MKYCIAKDLQHSFEQHHFVLLYEVLSATKIQALTSALSKKKLSGRDVALHSDEVRSCLFSSPLHALAKELSGQGKLRYGTDWVWKGPIVPWSRKEEAVSLQEMLCVRPLVLGCIIALSDGSEGHSLSFTLPQHTGDVLFFNAQDPFVWANLQSTQIEQEYLLLVYAGEKALYCLNPNDPCTHHMKDRGLVFGDRLPEASHPILIR